MDDDPKAAAGWYPDGSGGTRYWDGRVWTDYTSNNYWNKRQASAFDSSPGAAGAASDAPKVLGIPLHKRWQMWAVATVVALIGLGAVQGSDQPTSDRITNASRLATADTPNPQPSRSESATPRSTPTHTAAVVLFLTDQKDGDSFVASDGNEYRLGLVNAPETNERCGSQATAFTRQFLASGFTVNDYARDTYDRHVAEIFDRSHRSLNVALAKSGLGNDKYLEQFRHENVELGRRLDTAFASAATPACMRATPVPFVRKTPATRPAPVETTATRPAPVETTPPPAPVETTPPATFSGGCTTTSSGSCIRGGQFCPQAKYGQTGTDAAGRTYTCTGDSSHPHWQ